MSLTQERLTGPCVCADECVYVLPSVPGFTHDLKSRVCGESISAEAATSRPSALALRAFVSLLPFL